MSSICWLDWLIITCECTINSTTLHSSPTLDTEDAIVHCSSCDVDQSADGCRNNQQHGRLDLTTSTRHYVSADSSVATSNYVSVLADSDTEGYLTNTDHYTTANEVFMTSKVSWLFLSCSLCRQKKSTFNFSLL